MNNDWSRRSFLKGALVGAFLLWSNPAFPAELLNEEEARQGGSRLVLYNTHTDEKLDVEYKNSMGEYDPQALAAINHILRCHYTEEETEMDIRVIEFLNSVDTKLGGGNEIHVVSGYRSREYNEMLRKRNRRVAKYSFHLTGQAIDFRIPDVKLKNIKRAAMNMRCGGVGYYPKANFVHLDSGSFRFW